MFQIKKYTKMALLFFVFFVLTAFTLPTVSFAEPSAKCPCYNASILESLYMKYDTVKCDEYTHTIVGYINGGTIVYGFDNESCWIEENADKCSYMIEEHMCLTKEELSACKVIMDEVCSK